MPEDRSAGTGVTKNTIDSDFRFTISDLNETTI